MFVGVGDLYLVIPLRGFAIVPTLHSDVTKAPMLWGETEFGGFAILGSMGYSNIAVPSPSISRDHCCNTALATGPRADSVIVRENS